MAIPGEAQTRSENEVKALFFVMMARYTDWPSTAFATDASPVVIGVLGKDPFGNLLESLTKGEKVRGRPVKISRFSSAEEVSDCHMLFFGEMSLVRMELEIARLRNRPILTVSDRPKFADQGGMVEMFVNEERKVRLRVSKQNLALANLSLSPTLTRLAEIVASIEWLQHWNPNDWLSGSRSSGPRMNRQLVATASKK